MPVKIDAGQDAAPSQPAAGGPQDGTMVRVGGDTTGGVIDDVFEPSATDFQSLFGQKQAPGDTQALPEDQQAPEAPQWLGQMLAPLTEAFQGQQTLIQQLQGQQQQFQQTMLGIFQGNQQRAQEAARLQAMEATRPREPTTENPGDWAQYARDVSQWESRYAVAEARRDMNGQFDALKQVFTNEIKGMRAQFENTQRAQTEQAVLGAVAQLSQYPQYGFLKDPAIQETFFRRWAMEVQGNGGKSVDAAAVATKMLAEHNRMAALMAAKGKEVAGQKTMEARRADQQARGVPKPVRNAAGVPPASNQNKDPMASYQDRLRKVQQKMGAHWADGDLH